MFAGGFGGGGGGGTTPPTVLFRPRGGGGGTPGGGLTAEPGGVAFPLVMRPGPGGGGGGATPIFTVGSLSELDFGIPSPIFEPPFRGGGGGETVLLIGGGATGLAPESTPVLIGGGGGVSPIPTFDGFFSRLGGGGGNVAGTIFLFDADDSLAGCFGGVLTEYDELLLEGCCLGAGGTGGALTVLFISF